MAESVTDPVTVRQIATIKERLESGLSKADPNQRLTGQPVRYRVIDGHTLEIAYKEVARIDEIDVLAVKKVIGEDCCCSVSPLTAETLTVRFVVALKREEPQRS